MQGTNARTCTHKDAHSYMKTIIKRPPSSWANTGERLAGIVENVCYSHISSGHVTRLTWNVWCPSRPKPTLTLRMKIFTTEQELSNARSPLQPATSVTPWQHVFLPYIRAEEDGAHRADGDDHKQC